MAQSVNFVLPQYQGDVLDAQRKMMIAQALQQQSFQPTDTQGWNQMPITPSMGLAPVLSKLGQALIANKAMKGAIQAQRDVGMKQWEGMQGMFGGQPQGAQAASQGAQGQADGSTQQAQYTQGGGPLNPLGLSPQAAAMGFYTDPSGYMKDAVYGPMAQRMAPTDIMKNLAATGVDPNSTLGHQIMQDYIAKQNYIAPTAFRGGGYIRDPKTGQISNLPQVPEGVQAVQNPQTGQWEMQPVQGALGAIAASEGAKAAGKAGYQLTTGFDANGNPITTTVRQQAEAAGSGVPGAMGGATGGVGGALPSQLPAGASDLAKGYVERQQTIQQSAANAPQDIQAFKAIEQAASQVKTGAGFDRKAYLQSLAAVIPGISPNNADKVNADIITKYANQIASRNGGRSDAALESALHSITNTGMAPEAIKELTPSLIGLRQADMANAQARQAWLQAHGNNPLSLGQYENQWNKAYDPDIFRFQAMDPAQRAQFKAQMSPQQQQEFRDKIMQLQQLGAL